MDKITNVRLLSSRYVRCLGLFIVSYGTGDVVRRTYSPRRVCKGTTGLQYVANIDADIETSRHYSTTDP